MSSNVQSMVPAQPTTRPSWFDQVKILIERLPLPSPFVYLLAAASAVGLFALSDGLALGRPTYAFEPFHLVLALEPVYSLALMHLLDVRASQALREMSSLITPPEIYDDLRRELTTLPAGRAWFASLLGLLIGIGSVFISRVALPAAFRPFLIYGAGRWFVEIWLALSWFIMGALLYHTLRQLSVINHIYIRHAEIDLDNYQPLFHFSAVSGLTAIGLLAIPYAWNVAVPNLLSESIGASFGALFLIFGAVAFLWPLIGVRNLLAAAKRRALEENAQVLKEARATLYGMATGGELTGASELHDALAAIRAEREALLNVPTWPWAPGTIRSVIVALALPLIVWLLQWLLERLIGP